MANEMVVQTSKKKKGHITPAGSRMISEEVADNRSEVVTEVQQLIATIVRDTGLTMTELAVAMGVHAPPSGRGTSTVAHWKSGRDIPSPERLVTLRLLTQGVFRLRPIGMDGRRTVYEIFPLVCSACGGPMQRRGRKDACKDCGRQIAARDEDGVHVLDGTGRG